MQLYTCASIHLYPNMQNLMHAQTHRYIPACSFPSYSCVNFYQDKCLRLLTAILYRSALKVNEATCGRKQKFNIKSEKMLISSRWLTMSIRSMHTWPSESLHIVSKWLLRRLYRLRQSLQTVVFLGSEPLSSKYSWTKIQ